MQLRSLGKSRPSVNDSKRQTIFRHVGTVGFVAVPNELARDKRLSIEALGLLVFILSLPVNWDFHTSWVMQECRIGRRLYRMVRELIAAGYCGRERECGVSGKMGRIIYTFYAVSQLAREHQTNEAPHDRNLYVAPHDRKPHVENGRVYKRSIIKEVNTEKEESIAQKSKKVDLDQEFSEWYALYPRKQGKGQALRAYRAARKHADANLLLEGAKRAAVRWPPSERMYTPYPATWLNGQRWLDEPDASEVKSSRIAELYKLYSGGGTMQ